MTYFFKNNENHFFVNGLWYKIGHNGHLFFFDNHKWIKSNSKYLSAYIKEKRKFTNDSKNKKG